MQLIITPLNKVIDFVGALCGILMFLMLLNVFYDVLARYVFNDVSIGMQELEWHFFSAMFMFGIGYTLKEDGHVRVDVFYDQMPVKVQACINILGSLFLALPASVLVLYFGIDYTYESYEMGEGSADPGGLPNRWIIRSVIPISSAFVVLCLLQVVLTQIQLLLGKVNHSEKDA
ncbi:TRAP transporter small permease subunit [Agarilytica rhodophyticola]|uniref:TRAP transporter small permease subunit n=1 Tax=Agarilytica rhodophyticola TaxID=1737490 RepID=UPI00156E558C|nr:TRAP transporter small permease subunit [Agarilytica rhodophyticola]